MWACIGMVLLCGAGARADETPPPDTDQFDETVAAGSAVDQAGESTAVDDSDADGHSDAPAAVSTAQDEQTAADSGSDSDADEYAIAPVARSAARGEHTAADRSAADSSSDRDADENPSAPVARSAARGEQTAAGPSVTVAGAADSPGDSTVAIEDALDEQVTPLDAVAFSIENQEYEGAEEFLEHYIRAVESAHHRFDPGLVRPLTLLGDAQVGRQRYDLALQTYGRALHIRRVNDGLFAPEQVEVVYKQSQALQAIGNIEEAGNREAYAYGVLQKAYGPLDEKILPGTYRLAQWYRESFNIFAARALYERAMRIHEANGKQRSISALPALKGLVFTYRQERFPPHYVGDTASASMGGSPMPMSTRGTVYSQQFTINNFPAAERALQHIVQIRREDPQSTPIEVLEAILDLADWHLLWEHFRKAHTLYEFVFAQMDKLETVDAGEYFAEPRLLHVPLPDDPKAPRGRSAASATERTRLTGFIEASFRVSANGSVQEVEIVAADPEGLMDFRSRRSLRNSRYRPAMANGKAIPYENQAWRHEFRYVPRESVDAETVQGESALKERAQENSAKEKADA